MIIVRITDGLGNQLFQYAAGQALAERLQIPLALDLSAYTRRSFRPYLLDQYKLPARILNESLCRELNAPFVTSKFCKVAFRVRQAISSKLALKYVVETGIRSADSKSILSIDVKHVYIIGYWQRLEYFEHMRRNIIKLFQPKWIIGQETQKILARINASNSVGVSVRRGDYMIPHNRKFFGLLDDDWYATAAKMVKGYVQNPTYFVFSDDCDYVRENLKFPGKTIFVNHNNGGVPHDDLYILSQCKHHIIANSTFSWWGAWLSKTGGMTIAPKYWLVGKSTKSLGLLPRDWMTL